MLPATKHHLRTAADDQKRRLLSIGTSDGIERVQSSWPVGQQSDTQSSQPCVRIGGETDSRLMATDDGGEIQLLLNGVDGEHEIAGNSKSVVDPELAEASKEILGQVHPPVPPPVPERDVIVWPRCQRHLDD